MAVPVASHCFVLYSNHFHRTSNGPVVQRIKHLTKDLEVDFSNLTGVKLFDFLIKILSSNTSKYRNLKCPLILMQNIKKIGFQLKFVRQRFFIKLSIRFPLEVFLSDHRIFVAELNFSMMKRLHFFYQISLANQLLHSCMIQ